MFAVFGLVYRYAVRRDKNDLLSQGVVGAFALTKAFNQWDATGSIITSLPSLIALVLASLFAYFCAAEAINIGFSRNLLSPFPKY